MPNVIYLKSAKLAVAKPETRFSDEELRTWQFNIFQTMRKNPNSKGSAAIEAAYRTIRAEFEIRRAKLPNENTNGRPQCGIMSLYGYDAGKKSKLKKEDREERLVFISSVELLPIWGRSYMRSWGHPGTSQRLKAMRGFIQSQIKSHEDDRDYAEAVRDWYESLDYLGEIWKRTQH